jgi:hypothetical protein
MRRTVIAVAAACLAAAPVALAARAVAYQGFTSQGHEIKFKRTGAGVSRMSITVRARCENASGQSQGDYDFTLKATDTNADPVRRGSFTTVLPGEGQTPDATIKGKFSRRGTVRGTITASGRAKGPSGQELGTCKSPLVRFTAAP